MFFELKNKTKCSTTLGWHYRNAFLQSIDGFCPSSRLINDLLARLTLKLGALHDRVQIRSSKSLVVSGPVAVATDPATVIFAAYCEDSPIDTMPI